MSTGRDLIVFADDWGRYPSTIQYLGRVLAERHRIIWIGSLGLRKPEFHLRDVARVAEKASRWFRQPAAEPSSPVIQVHPFVLPFHDVDRLRRLNMASIVRAVRAEAERQRFVEPIVISASPLVGELAGLLGESSFHYVCLDDFTKFKGAFDCLATTERLLVERSETVFSVSDILRQTRVPVSGRSYFLPQGVDTDHFQRRGGEPPLALRALPRPWIGFFGIVAPWIDQGLLVSTARRHPSASVIVLGRVSTTTERLGAEPNIHLLGEVPYAELPSWGQWFDVGLIPFEVNELTVASNPLKLLEYLALGLPVVSTDLPEVRKFADVASVTRDAGSFVQAVTDALADRSDGASDLRRRRSLSYSWRAIADEVMSKVLEADALCRRSRSTVGAS
ncbi:MAG: glycosyltransferase [Bacteroidetes bacterium]|jgi:glycosyltransferase involved in cell wall biosynthesis|nr:glycosyltransferase [Bacteroidota bacterium]